MDLEETSDTGFPALGFPEVGTWNRTHNVPLENMKIDAPMRTSPNLLFLACFLFNSQS
ncbi:GH11694 [Drosophila grimshawi]|uniref:GH11694 n=1 Tax=Drosophila grimshawi TaxID=7222 RepID=B4JD02_DROGR|nr:GH11694 [Drosophila grimshawi]